MFTLYRIVKRRVSQSVPDRVSDHTRNAAFKAASAPERYCSTQLLKVERSVSDRFLKRSESSLNTFIGAEIATEPRFGKQSFQIKRSVANCMTDRASVHTEDASEQFLHRNRTLILVHCTGATFETGQKPIQYSVNIASMSVYHAIWEKIHIKGYLGIRTHNRQEESLPRPIWLDHSPMQPLTWSDRKRCNPCFKKKGICSQPFASKVLNNSVFLVPPGGTSILTYTGRAVFQSIICSINS